MADAVDSPEEVAAVREFFASLSVSEQHRLFQFFTAQMLEALPQSDWSDNTADGKLSAPVPAMAARNGL